MVSVVKQSDVCLVLALDLVDWLGRQKDLHLRFHTGLNLSLLDECVVLWGGCATFYLLAEHKAEGDSASCLYNL